MLKKKPKKKKYKKNFKFVFITFITAPFTCCVLTSSFTIRIIRAGQDTLRAPD